MQNFIEVTMQLFFILKNFNIFLILNGVRLIRDANCVYFFNSSPIANKKPLGGGLVQ